MVFHQDIHEHNIFLDGNGKLNGVIDWEFVSALPLWKASDLSARIRSPLQVDRRPLLRTSGTIRENRFPEDPHRRDENFGARMGRCL